MEEGQNLKGKRDEKQEGILSLFFFSISLNIFRIRLAKHFCEASHLICLVFSFLYIELPTFIGRKLWDLVTGFGEIELLPINCFMCI